MDVDLTSINEGVEFLGGLSVNSAAEGNTGSDDFLNSSLEFNSHTLGSELLGDVNNVVQLEVSVVLDILLLLSVSGSLLKGLDDKGSSSGQHGDEALSVLDHHLNLNFDSSPVGSGFLDIFTDLLGGHTEGTALGGKGSSTGNFTSNDFEVNYQLLEIMIAYRTSSHQ